MKLLAVLFSQSMRFIRFANPMGTIYMPDAVKALQDRYGFIQVPTSLQEYDLTKGVAFSHGKFALQKRLSLKGVEPEFKSDVIVIDKFQIYGNGMLAETKSFVESADLFIDDVIRWGTEKFGLRLLEDPPVRKLFMSQLEVKLDTPVLSSLVQQSNPITKQLSSYFKNYDIECPPFEINSFAFHYDLTNCQAPAPTAFNIERRAGHPYSSNVYFSGAPLTTRDHLDLLTILDKR